MRLLSRKHQAFSSQVYFLFLCLLIAPVNISAGSAETPFSITSSRTDDYALYSLPDNAKWSFSTLDLQAGKQVITTGNAIGVPLVPGSLTKLLITAAALDMNVKEKISMDTIIAADGPISDGKLKGNLYLQGSGNAFLSERDMEEAVEEIASRGIREITGSIIADDSLFDIRGWKNTYNGPAYASPGSLGLELHTVSISVFGRPPNTKIEPRNDEVRIIFVPNGKPEIRQIDDLTYEIRGNKTQSPLFRKRFSIKDPAIYAALTFRTLLRENGVNLKGHVARGETPPGITEICRMKARNLEDLIKDTNYNSLNVIAENLLYLIGVKRFGLPGTCDKGIQVVKEFLKEIELSHDGMSLADGSGLSPANRITSDQMVILLKKVSEKPWFDAFFQSLPRAGINGTLKDIGYVNEHIRAKSGQLSNVYCLAGFVERRNKSLFAFSYIVNVPGAELLGKDRTGLLLERLAGDGPWI